jgi:hypothetical protein
MNDRQFVRALRLLVGSALRCALVSATSAQANEPVVWTDVADPDPHFVAPPEPRAPARPQKARAVSKADAEEQAAVEAGRSLAQAAMAIEAAACKRIKEEAIPPEQRPLWARNCPP